MDNSNRKEHWEEVYATKTPDQVSWTQAIPQTSLDFIRSFGLSVKARIIDVGGGDSKLADHLLALGFEDITVLDISAKALEKAQKRLGSKARKVNWVVSDITDFHPDTTYDIWHDRATFHFLTMPEQVLQYLDIVQQAVTGFMTIGTFSENGPARCSGLEIRQYSKEMLTAAFAGHFDKLRCITEDHITPFDTVQHFSFCSFRRKKLNDVNQ